MAQSDDEEAILRIEQMWDDAWNRHDASALAALLSEDVDFVNVTGARFKGRLEFEERMRQTHQGIFRNTARTTLDTSVKFLTPEIAIVHARWEMRGLHNADGTMRPPWQGIITRVVRKMDDNWLVVAAHNVDAANSSIPPTQPISR
jgi:uncharacterized protein (TIGR02246 family)